MRKVLTKNFFNRPTLLVAEELLGKYLVRKIGKKPFDSAQGKEIALQITEVEAYDGPEDQASHAVLHRTGEYQSRQTKRNAVMFGPAGRWYVYFVYGMHWMLNVVTREEGYPAAVLIRGTKEVNGPGRLAKFLKIDSSLCGLETGRQCGLWFEDRGEKIPAKAIVRTARVGVSYAGPAWAKKPYRFLLVA